MAERTTALSQANTDLAREITDRQRAEEGLHESDLRFRQLAEHIHEVFYLYEVTADERIQILYISPYGQKTRTRLSQRVEAAVMASPAVKVTRAKSGLKSSSPPHRLKRRL